MSVETPKSGKSEDGENLMSASEEYEEFVEQEIMSDNEPSESVNQKVHDSEDPTEPSEVPVPPAEEATLVSNTFERDIDAQDLPIEAQVVPAPRKIDTVIEQVNESSQEARQTIEEPSRTITPDLKASHSPDQAGVTALTSQAIKENLNEIKWEQPKSGNIISEAEFDKLRANADPLPKFRVKPQHRQQKTPPKRSSPAPVSRSPPKPKPLPKTNFTVQQPTRHGPTDFQVRNVRAIKPMEEF